KGGDRYRSRERRLPTMPSRWRVMLLGALRWARARWPKTAIWLPLSSTVFAGDPGRNRPSQEDGRRRDVLGWPSRQLATWPLLGGIVSVGHATRKLFKMLWIGQLGTWPLFEWKVAMWFMGAAADVAW